eukprot:2646056-Rhodomonas_salina.2
MVQTRTGSYGTNLGVKPRRSERVGVLSEQRRYHLQNARAAIKGIAARFQYTVRSAGIDFAARCHLQKARAAIKGNIARSVYTSYQKRELSELISPFSDRNAQR